MAKIDYERRKRVMSRSIKLGHCVCDAAKSCPCPQFKEMNICACAGERPEASTATVALTKTVDKPGCASKINQKFLQETLGGLPHYADKNVLVGVAAGDDAGVYDMGDGTALVQTVDVFTPSVDDPYIFGQIAAANSVSDIYAMGGRPLTALSIIGFPVGVIADYALREIMRGGIEKMQEAGVSIIGGHSINDPQTKAGFAVTGIVATEKVKTNNAARPGDVLVLTKALGTGIISFANQIDRASQASIDDAIDSMTALNKVACELMLKYEASACTDVTGFSLMGHLKEMAGTSGLDAEIIWDKLPWLEGVLGYAAAGILPGAIENNKESAYSKVVIGDNVSETMADMCYDAQTSGGLLIAIAADRAEALLVELHQQGIGRSAIIGQFKQKGNGIIFLNTDNTIKFPEKDNAMNKENNCNEAVESSCCGQSVPASQSCCGDSSAASGNDAAGKFKVFMGAVNQPDGLDAFTKQAINIALSVLAKCKPCLEIHIKSALAKGFSEKEIDEAAWLAIAFGGSPIMMFYNEVKAGIKAFNKS